jgi:hypothetical protein
VTRPPGPNALFLLDPFFPASPALLPLSNVAQPEAPPEP